jgi:hypothetical protein
VSLLAQQSNALLMYLDNSSTIIPLEVWDCPGSTTVENLGAQLSQFSSVVFFIDIQVGLLLCPTLDC